MAVDGAESPPLLALRLPALQQLTKQFPRLPPSFPSSHSQLRSPEGSDFLSVPRILTNAVMEKSKVREMYF